MRAGPRRIQGYHLPRGLAPRSRPRLISNVWQGSPRGVDAVAVKLEEVRKVALALPDTTEEPHHNFGSFRVRGKIFVTIPPGGELLHIFLPAEQREVALAMDPEFLEPVHWGSKVLGVRAKLPLARKATVLSLVRQGYAFKSEQASTGAQRWSRRNTSKTRNAA